MVSQVSVLKSKPFFYHVGALKLVFIFYLQYDFKIIYIYFYTFEEKASLFKVNFKGSTKL